MVGAGVVVVGAGVVVVGTGVVVAGAGVVVVGFGAEFPAAALVDELWLALLPQPAAINATVT